LYEGGYEVYIMELKKLKFKNELCSLILKGEKTTTWRIFDDKDITKGDKFIFINSDTMKEFAKAEITYVKETAFKYLDDDDLDGHEKFSSKEEMYQTYSKYYKTQVTEDTSVKIIKFKIEE